MWQSKYHLHALGSYRNVRRVWQMCPGIGTFSDQLGRTHLFHLQRISMRNERKKKQNFNERMLSITRATVQNQSHHSLRNRSSTTHATQFTSQNQTKWKSYILFNIYNDVIEWKCIEEHDNWMDDCRFCRQRMRYGIWRCSYLNK